MTKYNHDGDSILDATGVDPAEMAKKAADLLAGEELNSVFIEQLENNFDKRSLAVLAFMFIHSITEDGDSLDTKDVQVIKIDKGDIPPELLRMIKEKMGDLSGDREEGQFDPTCDCPTCTTNRKKFEAKKKAPSSPIVGEGGNA